MPTLKHILKKILPLDMRHNIKRYKRKLKNALKGNVPKTTIDDLRHALVEELGIKRGDRILVTSGFASLNADYSPQQVVDLLKEIVGEEGVIGMPYYPPMNSNEWAEKQEVFDMRNTRSGMGVLTNVFAKSEGVVMTWHPIKALCLWGNYDYQPEKHAAALTPFYKDSPYMLFMGDNGKSIGLGVKNMPMFHMFEDLIFEDYHYCYLKKMYELKLIDTQGVEHYIRTLVHDGNLQDQAMMGGEYVNTLHDENYKRVPFGYTFLYAANNQALLETVRKRYAAGYTRWSK